MNSSTPNFDRVARIYRWAEYLCLGPLLQRTRTHFLPELNHCRQALVLGDGDGRFLARLLQQNRGLQAVAVDASAAMVKLLAVRCHKTVPDGTARLRIGRHSALTATPAKHTDLIVTHFFLDCLTQPEVDTLTQNLAAKVAPGTLWLVSDFAIPNRPMLRPFARLCVGSLYFVFSILTGLHVSQLPNPQSALSSVGFERIARQERLFGLLYTELWRRQ